MLMEYYEDKGIKIWLKLNYHKKINGFHKHLNWSFWSKNPISDISIKKIKQYTSKYQLINESLVEEEGFTRLVLGLVRDFAIINHEVLPQRLLELVVVEANVLISEKLHFWFWWLPERWKILFEIALLESVLVILIQLKSILIVSIRILSRQTVDGGRKTEATLEHYFFTVGHKLIVPLCHILVMERFPVHWVLITKGMLRHYVGLFNETLLVIWRITLVALIVIVLINQRGNCESFLSIQILIRRGSIHLFRRDLLLILHLTIGMFSIVFAYKDQICQLIQTLGNARQHEVFL